MELQALYNVKRVMSNRTVNGKFVSVSYGNSCDADIFRVYGYSDKSKKDLYSLINQPASIRYYYKSSGKYTGDCYISMKNIDYRVIRNPNIRSISKSIELKRYTVCTILSDLIRIRSAEEYFKSISDKIDEIHTLLKDVEQNTYEEAVLLFYVDVYDTYLNMASRIDSDNQIKGDDYGYEKNCYGLPRLIKKNSARKSKHIRGVYEHRKD